MDEQVEQVEHYSSTCWSEGCPRCSSSRQIASKDHVSTLPFMIVDISALVYSDGYGATVAKACLRQTVIHSHIHHILLFCISLYIRLKASLDSVAGAGSLDCRNSTGL